MFNPNTTPRDGAQIAAALNAPIPEKTPLIAEFLYRRKLTLISADPGCGKSTIATQVALSAAAGVPVFGIFDVPKPCKVYYIAFETDWDEFIAALAKARNHIPFDSNLLHFDDGLLGIDAASITNAHQTETQLIARIAKANPDIIIIDPAFLLVSGDLADGAIASRCMNFVQKLAAHFKAGILVLHHTHREKYSASGKKIKEKDATYGSRWIQAAVVLQWSMSSTDSGVSFTKTKDRYKLSRPEFILHYDSQTGLCTADGPDRRTLPTLLFSYLKCQPAGTSLTYHRIATAINCAEGYLAVLMQAPEIRTLVEKHAPLGKQVTFIRKPDTMIEGTVAASQHAAPPIIAPLPNVTLAPDTGFMDRISSQTEHA